MPHSRSFIIPVLDFSPHSQHNIHSLLFDLDEIEGEVICIFNSEEVFEELREHARIDKFCFNKTNAGVSRSWNEGIALAEGDALFILNADLHVGAQAIERMQEYLFSLPDAVLVGPQGTMLDFAKLQILTYYDKGAVQEPVRTDDVSGFFFAIHRERYAAHGLAFDVRFSPCFLEEWDLAMQVKRAGLACYTVPVTDYEHEWGISGNREDVKLQYFGRTVSRNAVLAENQAKFLAKWFGAR